MSILKKILLHSFWLILGNSIGRLAMFVTNIFAARILSQEIFGQFMMIRSTINIGGSFLSGALGISATKKVAEVNQADKDRLPSLLISIFTVNAIALLLIILFFVFFSSWIVEAFFLGVSNLIIALYIGLLLLSGSTFSALIQSILIGFEQFKKVAFLSIIVSVISIPLILFLIHTFRLYGALLGVSFYFILDFILKFLYLKLNIKHYNFSIHLNEIAKISRELISFSMPIGLALLVNAISFWYARVIIVNASKGFSDIAVFDAAYQWLTIITIITGATTSVALPMLSKAFVKNDKKEISKVFYLNLMVNAGIAVGIAGFFILLSKQIMGLYGDDYIQGNTILIVLSITSIFFSISSIYNRYMITHNKVWLVFFASFFGMVILFWVLISLIKLQALGLAWSFFAYYSSNIFIYLLAHFYKKCFLKC